MRRVGQLEDIVDTGATLTKLKAKLLSMGAADVRICTLLDKRERRTVALEPEYVGFPCPNEFVIGYGLDYDAKYRELPYVGVLKPEFI